MILEKDNHGSSQSVMIIGNDHKTDVVLKLTVTVCLLHQQNMLARFARLRRDAKRKRFAHFG
jgi:hypothetical protein